MQCFCIRIRKIYVRENNACIDTILMSASAVNGREYLEQNYLTLRRKLDQVRKSYIF